MDKESDYFTKKPCPNCGRKSVEVESVGYSCPAVYFLVCKSCNHRWSGSVPGTGIKVISGEEAVRKRPELYLDCDNETYREIAEEEMRKRNEESGGK